MKITIGTRGSQLALAQANEVKQRLEEGYPDLKVELKIIKTKGDKRLDLSLNASGDKGLFTKELEYALMAGEIDCAVHSLKDLPVELTEGTLLSAILPREDSRDALLGQYSFGDLPEGAVVGTSSPRRAAQLLEQRPDLEIKEIRGNVETRIAKLKAGEYDAIVMATAGLKRLGLGAEITYQFTEFEMVPAPGQAAIAVQQLASRQDLAEVFATINCEESKKCTEIERFFLKKIGGGCALPYACHCSPILGMPKGKEGVYGEQASGYFISIYNLEDAEQTLKGFAVSGEATLDEIWQYSQEATVPIDREKFN